MVSTHQQYLCPDYMNTLSSNNNLDSNKSPLALLAQTCNSIGASPSGSENGHSAPQPQPPQQKPSSKTATGSVMTSGANKTAPALDAAVPAPKKDHGAHNQHGGHKKTHQHQKHSPVADSTTGDKKSTTPKNVDDPSTNGKKSADTVSPVPDPQNSVVVGSSPPMAKSFLTSAAQPSFAPSYAAAAAAAFYSQYLQQNPQLATGAAYAAYPPGFFYPTAQQQPSLFSAAGNVFPRFCADPCCKNCPAANSVLMSAFPRPAAAAGSCPVGCSQCAMTSSLDVNAWYSSLLGLTSAANLNMNMNLNPNMISPTGSNFLQSLYQTTSSSSLTSGQQHVCQWNNGDKCCGKVCQTAEELLQHLRAHSHELSASCNNNTITVTSPSSFIASVTNKNAMTSSPPVYTTTTLNAMRYHPYKLPPSSLAPMPYAGPPLSSTPYIGFPTAPTLLGSQKFPHM